MTDQRSEPATFHEQLAQQLENLRFDNGQSFAEFCLDARPDDEVRTSFQVAGITVRVEVMQYVDETFEIHVTIVDRTGSLDQAGASHPALALITGGRVVQTDGFAPLYGDETGDLLAMLDPAEQDIDPTSRLTLAH